MNFALESDILMELVRCFDDEDDDIRELASRAIIKSAGSETGRFVLIRDEYVPKIRDLFDDKIVQIRANAYLAMINIAEFTFGIDSIIQCNIIPILVTIEPEDQPQHTPETNSLYYSYLITAARL